MVLPAAVSCVFLLFTLFAPIATAQVVANFDGGNGTTEVDGYEGKAGNGWTAGWDQWTGGGGVGTPTIIRSVTNTDPLVSGGGNYLHSSLLKDAIQGTLFSRISRPFESFGVLDTGSRYTISLLQRFDGELLAGTSRFYLYDGTGRWPGDNDDSTWAVTLRNFDDKWQWLVSDGNGMGTQGNIVDPVATGVEIIYGSTYSIHLDIDRANGRYAATIINLDYQESVTPGLAQFSSGWLDLQSVTTVVNQFNIGTRWTSSDAVTFSTDSIAIVPEPAAGWMIGCIALLSCGLFRRLRRR